MDNAFHLLEGTVLDEENTCSFGELCRVCGTSESAIREMIAEGIICPEGAGPEEWRFTLVSIHRVQTVTRLTRDLRVNLPGCALALELLDELDRMRCLLHKNTTD